MSGWANRIPPKKVAPEQLALLAARARALHAERNGAHAPVAAPSAATASSGLKESAPAPGRRLLRLGALDLAALAATLLVAVLLVRGWMTGSPGVPQNSPSPSATGLKSTPEALSAASESNPALLQAALEGYRSQLQSVQTLEADFTITQKMEGQEWSIQGTYRGRTNGQGLLIETQASTVGKSYRARAVVDGSACWVEYDHSGLRGPASAPEAPQVQRLSLKTAQELQTVRNPLIGYGGFGWGICNLWQALREAETYFQFTQARTGKLDQEEFTVIQGTPRPEAFRELVRRCGELWGEGSGRQIADQVAQYSALRIWIRKTDGAVRRLEVLDTRGEPIRVLTLTRWVANPALAPDLFRYIPPAEARVVDLDLQYPPREEAR